MAKEEPKQFPTITLQLTPKQRESLALFAADVGKGFVASDGTDTRRAVLADIRVLTGEVKCFLLQSPETQIVNRAIMRARKQLK